MIQSLSTKTIPDLSKISKGDVVTLINCSDSWGSVVEVVEKHGWLGARVLWTMKGYICWSPIGHLVYKYTPKK